MIMKKDFENWVKDVIGRGMNFTPNERGRIKENLKNTLYRWRIKGLIGKDELPAADSEIIWEWKRDHDKDMIIKLVRKLNNSIVNYRRKVFGLKGDKLNEPKPSEYEDNKVAIHTDDEVPSVAIIPFRNKGKEEDAFYAYGICADLISDCSSAGLIRVASLEQIEELGDLTLKEKVKQLDVRYTATGTLWKMDKIFQLSIELYDTKESKVIWSDRWEEKWDNLPLIKGSLSDGLLKALDTTSKVEKKVETANTEAYEYYLQGKYKYEKRENMEDTELANGLLKKAIELDDNLLCAKQLLGWVFYHTGDVDRAKLIFQNNLKQAEKLDDKSSVAEYLGSLATYYADRSDYDIALEYVEKSIEIYESN